MLSQSYDEVPLPDPSIIYCDPPYADTADYLTGFSHPDFYRWLRESPHLIFISEYRMPDDFIEVESFEHRSTFSGINNAKRTQEKVYIHRSKIPLYLAQLEGAGMAVPEHLKAQLEGRAERPADAPSGPVQLRLFD